MFQKTIIVHGQNGSGKELPARTLTEAYEARRYFVPSPYQLKLVDFETPGSILIETHDDEVVKAIFDNGDSREKVVVFVDFDLSIKLNEK